MVKRVFFAALTVALLAAPATHARSICAERDSMISKLKDKYGEAERGMGLSGGEAVVEIWSSSKTGTWTIVMTRPDGVSCVMAAGDSWMDMPPEQGPET